MTEQPSSQTPNAHNETAAVAESQRFDERRFAAYLADRIGARLLEISQMTGGQSNPTFLIVTDQGEYVLRKQPAGNLLPSAHAIDREFKVMSALAPTDFPVPKAILYCYDTNIIGTPFYLMERLHGRVFTDSVLPGVSPQDRRQIYLSMAETLAKLHRIDWRTAGLEGYGRSEEYYRRQIKRWSGQWEKSKTRENPAIDRLIAWLPKNVPAEAHVAVAHGDFRLYNIMFHVSEPRIVGILDWELSTLAPGIADLAHSCLNYYLPAKYPNSLLGADLQSLGIPSEAEFIARYCEVAGYSEQPAAFHRAFALFRLAVIVEGILARVKSGTAANARAAEADARGIQIADRGWQLASG